jgi:hypothetical protein
VAEPNGRVTIDKRLRTLEQGQIRLESDLTGLHDDLKSFTSDVKSFMADSRTAARTPLTVIVACIGALALIVGGFSLPYVQRLERVEADFVHHDRLDGHPVVLSRLEEAKLIQQADADRNHENIGELDDRLQREMRDLDTTLKSESDGRYWKARSERFQEKIDELEKKP